MLEENVLLSKHQNVQSENALPTLLGKESSSSNRNSNENDGTMMLVDKENAVEINFNVAEQTTSPIKASPTKRTAEDEHPTGSPESDAKKARTEEINTKDNNNDDDNDSGNENQNATQTTEALLEMLAQAKETLAQSKQTLEQLKEQHQAVLTSEQDMTARLTSFGTELAKLQKIHAANGEELKTVLELRNNAREKFDVAEKTLENIRNYKDNKPSECLPVETKEAVVVTWKRESVAKVAGATTDTGTENNNNNDKTETTENKKEQSTTEIVETTVEETTVTKELDGGDVVTWKREFTAAVAEKETVAESNMDNKIVQDEKEDKATNEIKSEESLDAAEAAPMPVSMKKTATSDGVDNEEEDREINHIESSLAKEMEDDDDDDESLVSM